MSLCVAGEVAQAAPVTLLRTPGYEAPVHAGPDDLLLLAGVGLEAGDRVVYESAGTDHAAKLPETNTAERGMARVVQVADPPYALTIQMPGVIQAERIYRLWVLNPQGEDIYYSVTARDASRKERRVYRAEKGSAKR